MSKNLFNKINQVLYMFANYFNQRMKYCNKPKIIDVIRTIFELIFRKTGKILVAEHSRQKVPQTFLEFSNAVTADVKPLLPAYLSKVG